MRQSKISFRVGMPLLFFIGVGLVLFYVSSSPAKRSVVEYAVNPALERTSNWGTRLRRLIVLPWRAAALEQEATALRARLQALAKGQAEVAELRKENSELRKELAFEEQEKYPLTIARVIARIKENGSTFLIINRGTEQRIVVGMPAISGGALIGKIIKTNRATSVVAPLTAAGIKTAVTFPGNAATAGIVEGELNVNLIARFIPKDIAVNLDNSVITSGLEERIPRGLLVGLIAKIDAAPQDLFQTAYVRPLIKIDALALVSIIGNPEIAVSP